MFGIGSSGTAAIGLTTLLGALLGLGPVAAPAQAGTVRSGTEIVGEGARVQQRVVYRAAAGEANDVILRKGSADVTIGDAGAPVVAGDGCVQIAVHEARCSTVVNDRDLIVEVFGGDGPDRLAALVATAPAFSPVLDGGPGDDRLRNDGPFADLSGGSGRDTLTGGRGSESLAGGPGDDVVRGGAGNDTLAGDSPRSPAGDDVLDGGGGRDSASWSEATSTVRVDLSDPGPDGRAGERDRLRDIEHVATGAGDDVIVGDAGANVLESGRGRDTVIGRGGNDVLLGGDRTARLFGGAGNDTIAPVDAHIRCGAGHDAVRAPELGQQRSILRLDTACEWYDAAEALQVARTVRVVGRHLIVTVRSRQTRVDWMRVYVARLPGGRTLRATVRVRPLRVSRLRIPLVRGLPGPGRPGRTTDLYAYLVGADERVYNGPIEIDWSRAAASP